MCIYKCVCSYFMALTIIQSNVQLSCLIECVSLLLNAVSDVHSMVQNVV